MRILISGTPGVGKTEISKLLASKFNLTYFSVSNFIMKNRLYVDYDEIRKTYNIDDRVIEKINNYIDKIDNVVIETIYPSLIDKADKVIVLRKNPLELYRDLKYRNWGNLKIAENVEAEILGVVAQEAKEWFENVCEINVTNKSKEEVMKDIIDNICDSIDWLSDNKVQDLLIELDKVISLYENI